MFRVREIFEVKKISDLLHSLGLKTPENIEYTVGVYDGDKLIGTGSLVGNILQGIGVDPCFQGEGVSALIVTNLLKKTLEMGKEELFIFTKPEEAHHFQGMGFKKVAEASPFAVLLEWGKKGIEEYKAGLKKIAEPNPDGASCIVMNGNPFTLGHRYLIEKAARESSWLYVLVVEEDRSLFPFHVRLELIKKGTSDLKKVTVIPSGKYVISSLTFPSYFTRETDLIRAQASLDLEIFANHIAPSLKVVKRYVGEEPYCPVTACYNQLMKQILIQYGIEVLEVERLKTHKQAVSASWVRELIREGRMEEIKELVPSSTYEYLFSPEAQDIVERIKMTQSRH
jgi:[citrate (pro-3S)-lyase] ligase